VARLEFSPATRRYLEEHAVDPQLAHELGVRSDHDVIVYPYTTPRGGSYTRRRNLADKITKQPKGEPLILWWPDGRPDPGANVLLCEGEPDALAALSARNGYPVSVAALPGTEIPLDRVTAELAVADAVYLALDGDEPGRRAADRLARALQQFTNLKVIRLGDGEDLASRLCREEDREAWLRGALEGARDAPQVALKDEPEGYRRKPADKLRDLLAKGIDPDKLDLAELLSDVEAFLRRYVYMSDAEAVTVALWVAHVHALDASRVTPYLSITSAEAGSGKTLLLEVLATIVATPWLTGRTTAAVLPRKVDKVRPTLLLDESDTAFRGDKDYAVALHGILNSGYKRSGASTLCVGQGANIDFRDFSTFCPKAFAGIAKLPDTVRARSFAIRLVKLADEHVEEFTEEDAEPEAERLRDRLEAFALRGVDRLARSSPERLSGVDPRTKEISKPLLAVAELAGGEWPRRARRALGELAGADGGDDPSIGVQLLRDIRTVFDGMDTDRISSVELREGLTKMDESPWGEWRKGLPITQRGITKLLKPYGISKRDVRFGDSHTKGYKREQFGDAWKRYLRTSPSQTRDTGDNGSSKPETAPSEPATEPSVSPVENAEKPHGKAYVAGVAGSDPVTRADETPTTLEDAILDPVEAEKIRARVNGTWETDDTDVEPALVLDYTGNGAARGCSSHPKAPVPGCRYCGKALTLAAQRKHPDG
jgi:Protein of unknown function (DUF3631)/Toprim-like